MKALYGSSALIVSANRFTRNLGMHDRFPTHAESEFARFDGAGAASGDFYVYGNFILKNAVEYFYPVAKCGPDVPTDDFLTAVLSPAGAPLFLNYFGERWNFILRPGVFGKYTSDEWDAFLLSH